MNSNALLNSLTKCRLDLSPDYSCLTISKILIAIGMAGLMLIALALIIKYTSKQNE